MDNYCPISFPSTTAEISSHTLELVSDTLVSASYPMLKESSLTIPMPGASQMVQVSFSRSPFACSESQNEENLRQLLNLPAGTSISSIAI